MNEYGTRRERLRSLSQTARVILLTVLATAVVSLALLGALAWSGVYNVAATSAHGDLAAWLLSTVKRRSIEVDARRAPPPPALTAARLTDGTEHFRQMCVGCHGAPGIQRGETGQGMNPEPPDLDAAASVWSDRELFWIIKHGIKFAGMPAFGPTHTDEEIWNITAFVRQLPRMSASDYQKATQKASPSMSPSGAEDVGAHSHHPHAH